MKFFKTVFLGRDNELTYRHINEGDTKYVLYVIPKPPQEPSRSGPHYLYCILFSQAKKS